MKRIELEEYVKLMGVGYTSPDKIDYEGRNLNDDNHSNLADPSLKVVELTNVCVTPDGFVFSDEYFITDLGYSDCVEKNIVLAEKKMLSDVVMNEASLVGGHANYYHWLLNWLPRLFLLEICGFNKRKLLVGQAWAGFQSLTYKYFVDETKYDVVRIRDVVFVKRLLVPVFFKNPKHAPFAISQLRCRARLDMVESESKKIYISRRSALGRKVVNEESFFSMLECRGYVLVELETLTFQEQVRLFANATHVVAPHGAGLVNMVFSKRLVVVVEIFNTAWSRVFWSLGAVVGVEKYSSYNALPIDNGLKPQLHDLKIDIEEFVRKFNSDL
jgi:capsular polysaccharide biosynthesis protein